MARIIAKGETEFGEIGVIITGEQYVSSIESDDDSVVMFFADHIEAADGEMANAYHPESNTMLQAFAFCQMIFDKDDIAVEGDIGEMEYEDGVIY